MPKNGEKHHSEHREHSEQREHKKHYGHNEHNEHHEHHEHHEQKERECCNGRNGLDGRNGLNGLNGKRGHRGRDGKRGKRGHCGEPGISGGADFYALMPNDNESPVAPGADVSFPQDGVNTNDNITRISDYTFNVAAIGTYLVQFQVSVTEPGQLCLALNGIEEPFTVVGRATGTSQLVGNCLIKINNENTIVSVRNPASETTALTITPVAGGTQSVSAHLVFLQIE